MAIFKCKMCGGTIEFTEGATVGSCDSCGTKQTLPKTNDDVTANLFNRANNLRLKCEFDKAAAVYEKIVEQDDSESEAHWGLVLCKYGIEYVDDPKTHRRMPTCHRTLFDAVTTDADYQAAIDYSDSLQQSIYEQEARSIDRIQKDILAIVKNEKPFDIFICYKETDENGKRSLDSAIANDIYYQLTQEGFKVFYAAITLEDKLGQEYEPYIFAALNSSKVMLVLGTKPEFFTAVWVKNEWSRFMALMKTDRTKLLIPCYRDMDAYDLPEEFAHLQAQDMSKIGFINDVVRGIKKVVVRETPKEAEKEVVVQNTGNNSATLLKRAFMFLEDGDWAKADDFCEQVLNIDPECAEAYLGKLMAVLNVKNQDGLQNCPQPFDGNINYQKAIRFGNDKLKTGLQDCIAYINDRNEKERLAGFYDNAMEAMNEAETEDDFKVAEKIFSAISGYRDADALAERCLQKAEECRINVIYDSAKEKMEYSRIADYTDAIKILMTIPGWRDSAEQIKICRKKIDELHKKEEEARISSEKSEKQLRKFCAIGLVLFIILIVFLVYLANVILPNSRKTEAMELIEKGEYESAYSLLLKNGDNETIAKNKYDRAIKLIEEEDYDSAILLLNGLNYNDSEAQIEGCYTAKYGEKKWNEMINIEIGDTITFGSYEQNNNTSDGKEKIKWTVLDKNGSSFLLISNKCLDCQKYNDSESDYESCTWETCTLRTWLNETFLTEAFSEEEQAMIRNTTVTAHDNPKYGTYAGNDTTDKVFLLSIPEANKYLPTKADMKCIPTKYAIAQGASTSEGYMKNGKNTCRWWLRTPGYYTDEAAAAGTDGIANCTPDANSYGYCVRPVIWVNPLAPLS